MFNYKIILEYDGTLYHGFAKQDVEPTVQGVLEKVLSDILKEKIEINASGRTDKSVHALGQVINFKTNVDISNYGLVKVLNSRLPDDIVVKSAEKVDENFHARYSTKTKTYLYILNNKRKSAFSRNYETYSFYKLDIEKMKKGIKLFEGKHDFKSYMSTGSSKRNTLRTITNTKLYEKDDRIFMEFTGDGFLYNQVRIMVGALIELGRGKISIKDIENSFDNYSRDILGKTADPEGLYLKEVNY